MTVFEENFLLCRTVGFAPTDLFYSSGPADILEPYSSVMVQSIVEYQSTEIADTISRLPQTKWLRQSESETLWRWKRKEHFIEISVDADNTTEDGVWLASRLTLNCTFADLVEVWLKLRDKHPRHLSSLTVLPHVHALFISGRGSGLGTESGIPCWESSRSCQGHAGFPALP
jgi:hypothetical protein